MPADPHSVIVTLPDCMLGLERGLGLGLVNERGSETLYSFSSDYF